KLPISLGLEISLRAAHECVATTPRQQGGGTAGAEVATKTLRRKRIAAPEVSHVARTAIHPSGLLFSPDPARGRRAPGLPLPGSPPPERAAVPAAGGRGLRRAVDARRQPC